MSKWRYVSITIGHSVANDSSATAVGETGSRQQRWSPDAGWVDRSTMERGPRGYRLCRFCNEETPSARRTFCSNGCVHEHRVSSFCEGLTAFATIYHDMVVRSGVCPEELASLYFSSTLPRYSTVQVREDGNFLFRAPFLGMGIAPYVTTADAYQFHHTLEVDYHLDLQ